MPQSSPTSPFGPTSPFFPGIPQSPSVPSNPGSPGGPGGPRFGTPRPAVPFSPEMKINARSLHWILSPKEFQTYEGGPIST